MPIGQSASNLADRFEAARPARSAQFAFDAAQLAQPHAAFHPAIDERMRQKCHQRHGRSLVGHYLGEQQQQATGGCLRQGPPRGIIGCDIPAVEVMDHAPRQSAVGRYDGHTLFRFLQRLAHQQGNGLRLLLGIGAGHYPDARQATLLGGQIDPALARFGREEQRPDRMATLGRRGGQALAVPRLHFLPPDAHAIEQQLEMVLRVSHSIVACERRIARLRCCTRPAQFVPHRLGYGEIEIGQDDSAVFQIGDDPQQLRQRRRRAGHTGSDDGCFRRIVFPPPSGPFEQAVAPRGGIKQPLARKLLLPQDLDCREIPQAVLPVGGQIGINARHRIIQQVCGIDIFHQEPIHRRPRLPREAQQGCPLGCAFAHHAGQELRQFEQAPLRINGRRYVRRAQWVEQRPERFIEVEIADHRHARHQQPRSAHFARVTDEGFGNRPARTAARHQHRQPRQPEFGIDIARDEPRNQRIGETAMRGDRINLRLCALSHP